MLPFDHLLEGDRAGAEEAGAGRSPFARPCHGPGPVVEGHDGPNAATSPEGKFITVDGVRLHYIERGAGPVIVLLHGNGTMARISC